MEMQKNVTAESVKEVWVIDIGHGSLLPPMDEDGCDSFMAFPTEGDARMGLQSQIDKGYIDNGDVKRIA